MADSAYPSNSHKSKQAAAEPAAAPERREVKPVITGEAIKRKPPLSKRIAETFTGDDAQSVGAYLLLEVVVPAVKSLISEAVSQGTDRMLWGDAARMRSAPGRGGRTRVGHTPYNTMSGGGGRPVGNNRTEPQGNRSISRHDRESFNFKEILLEDRGDAEIVLDRLGDLIDEYQTASVADLYSLTGISQEFTDNRWGWDSLEGARVVRAGRMFMLDLPVPIAL